MSLCKASLYNASLYNARKVIQGAPNWLCILSIIFLCTHFNQSADLARISPNKSVFVLSQHLLGSVQLIGSFGGTPISDSCLDWVIILNLGVWEDQRGLLTRRLHLGGPRLMSVWLSVSGREADLETRFASCKPGFAALPGSSCPSRRYPAASQQKAPLSYATFFQDSRLF